jgi:hypothetical protein
MAQNMASMGDSEEYRRQLAELSYTVRQENAKVKQLASAARVDWDGIRVKLLRDYDNGAHSKQNYRDMVYRKDIETATERGNFGWIEQQAGLNGVPLFQNTEDTVRKLLEDNGAPPQEQMRIASMWRGVKAPADWVNELYAGGEAELKQYLELRKNDA